MAEILVIDDMAGVRRTVEAMLKRDGHKVTAATNGAEGLDLLEQRRFDLVICDILMPKVDGTEVIFRLNAMPNRPPVLAISGGGAGVSAGDALQMARLKADAFLEKPFDKEQFMSAVGTLLAKRA
jgi:CheY-like chemotaxis protein